MGNKMFNRTIEIVLLFVIFSAHLTAKESYSISGKVVDKTNNEPLIGVDIYINELRTGTTTNVNGIFTISNVPPGTYSLRVSYLGYAAINKVIIIEKENLTELYFALTESTINLDEVVVTGNPFLSDPKEISQTSISLSQLDLIVKSGGTIGNTLDFLPGVAMRSNGIATGRPVIRGFSNNKVLILEDGLRMGDLSSASDDHSISGDGSEPEKIEVLEGPSSLLYGNNAVGGVVNIITDAIPTYVSEGLTGEFLNQYSSVNNEYLTNLHLNYGLGLAAFHSKVFKRKGDDYKIGGGEKTFNSDLDSYGYQLGLSFHPEWGMSGVSYTDYNNKYGLPTIPSADEIVYIDMHKKQLRFQTDIYKINSFLQSMSLKAGYMDYNHKEISRSDGAVGTSFGLKTGSADLSFMHRSVLGSTDGIVGLYALYQDYDVSGEEALTPNAKHYSFAAYFLEKYKLSDINLSLGARYELNKINIPEAVLTDSVFTSDTKNFNTLSASLGLTYSLSENESFYLNGANAFRSPTIAELSSYSIHEAQASFDIGNRALSRENTLGLDFGFRSVSSRHNLDINLYYNSVSNFIYREPQALYFSEEVNPQTGNEVGFNTDEEGFKVYKYSQADAVLYGYVIKFSYEILHGLQTTLISDYVRAKNTVTEENLPQIPPLRLSIELRYSTPTYWFGGTWKLVNKQNDVAANEEPTPGYGLINIYSGIKIFTGRFSHIINLKVNNLFDHLYKDHLSAIKDFTFMPGRNIELNYKLVL